MDRPLLIDSPLAFVDVETTGGHPLHHRVIEIGVVLARGGEIEESWSTLVDPESWLPPTIQRLTGIEPQSLEGAPRFGEVAAALAQRLEGRLFVAHNARFDYGFIRQELKRAGFGFQAKQLCTVRLSRRLFPQYARHNLDSLILQHELPCASRHRALPDAMVLWQFWRKLRAERPAGELEAALEALTRRASLPPQLPEDLVDDLPEYPGVYRFYGEGNSLLYVGKAMNIRERVMGRWGSAARDLRSRRLSEQVRRVEWTETAGELGALLLEARTVRDQQPVYNRQLRGAGNALTWIIDLASGEARLHALEDGWPDTNAFGFYRSEREARKGLEALAREQGLCLKVLGLERAEGSCFAYQVGKCRGACVGAEPLARHSVRSQLALAGEQLKPWPYAGAVAVHERAFSGLEQWHVIDAWRHLGTIDRDDAAGSDVEPQDLIDRSARDASFDVDAYRVIARYLRDHAARVKPWPPQR